MIWHNDIADTMCDAPDDHHCKFVFLVECDKFPEARSSLDIATVSAKIACGQCHLDRSTESAFNTLWAMPFVSVLSR